MKKFSVIALCVAVFIALFFISCGDDPVTPDNDDTGSADNESGGDSDEPAGDNGPDTGAGDGTVDGDTPVTEGADYPPDTDNMTAWNEQDDDGDGIKNGTEGTGDADGDGTPDYNDTDADGDGLDDSVEAPSGIPVDTDADTTPDFQDTDSDNDGVPDGVEGTGDADGDGNANYRDVDADGDGMYDSIECDAQPCVDTDGDGAPNYLDNDADGDGVPDLYEGNKDMDGDGIPSYLDDDADGDGILDNAECPAQPCVDTDGDDAPNFKDKDSDNDGLTDEKETQIGTDPTKTDSDGDGVDDNTELAAGSDPVVSDPGWWDGKYYVILPYKPGVIVPRTLDFNTSLKKVDVLFIFDVSGSMQDEIDNLKIGILNTIIPGLATLWPNDNQAVGYGLMTFGRAKSYDKVTQPITTLQTQINSAINAMPSASGGDEPFTEALYQAATGEGLTGTNSGYFPPPNCTAPDNRGGACFRKDALPIFLMVTDEAFTGSSSDPLILAHDRTAAINAMNAAGMKAKFIGINTYGAGADGPASDYTAMSEGTQSFMAGSNPHQYFNYIIDSDGTGLSNQVVDAVASLAGNVSMTVTTKKEKFELPESYDDAVNSADFISAVTPKLTYDANGTPVITCPAADQCDGTSFYGVKPGTGVTFDIAFENHIYEPTDSESRLFKATITVLGEGSALDARDVYVIVPGIIETGGED
ncbi:MAG TPA: hypothetical protein PLV42_01030 [bacterium]|nr:hypothetical protein [bacterium]